MNENTEKVEEKEVETKPDEQTGFYFSSALKIFDPNNQEILVQMRGDN